MKTKAGIALAPVLVLALAACGGDGGSDYGTSGRVVKKQTERECKEKIQGRALTSALTKSTGGSSSGGRSGGSSTSGSRGGTSVKKPGSSSRKDGSVATGGGAASSSGGTSGKSCKTEYELFIRDGSSLVEEDVSKEHYRRCGKGDKFPQCTR